MARPGVEIQVQTAPQPQSAPTDSGVAFMVGLCDMGPLEPILIRSLSDFVANCGSRVTYSVLYDAVDAYFREGGNTAYISRVVGPAAVVATRNLMKAATVSLIATAIGPGTWGNSVSIAVLAPLVSGYRLQVLYNGVVVETSGDLATQAEGIAWSQNSNYVRLTLGAGTGVPDVAAAAALAGGSDDRNNIVDAQWLTALSRFDKGLGPGQVLAPGRTTDVGHQQLADHAQNFGRVALLDLIDSSTKATLEASVAAAKIGSERYAAAFAPWIVIPGTVANTTRTVPPSASVAGVIARVDASDNPNTAAAGDRGLLLYASDLSQPAWTDADRQELNGTGVNVIRAMFNGFRIYGFRSMADPASLPSWLDFSNVRYMQWLASRCYVVGERYVFETIDGQGHVISAYGGELSSLVQADYNAGMVFGSTAGEAFRVDVGASVNTPVTIANGNLRAVVSVRPSPFAELVSILIVNVPVTGAV